MIFYFSWCLTAILEDSPENFVVHFELHWIWEYSTWNVYGRVDFIIITIGTDIAKKYPENIPSFTQVAACVFR